MPFTEGYNSAFLKPRRKTVWESCYTSLGTDQDTMEFSDLNGAVLHSQAPVHSFPHVKPPVKYVLFSYPL
jgi:hypothetical protein